MLASKQCENKSGLLAYRCSSILHSPPLPRLALKQAYNEQYDNCAKERNNDRGEVKSVDSIRHIEECASKPATHQRANNADHDVANQAKARSFHDLACQPTSNCTDNNPR